MAITGHQRRALTAFHLAGEVFGRKSMERLENPSRPNAAYYLLRALRIRAYPDGNVYQDSPWIPPEEERGDPSEDRQQ